MAYTVSEMARLLGIPASTLRYYDKEGLLPFVKRSPGGIRMFQEKDYEWLKMIGCLKRAGMSLKDIREYILLSLQGDSTIAQRLELFRKQKETLTRQMEELKQTMQALDDKCWYYETAAESGSPEAPVNMSAAQVPDQFCCLVKKRKDVPGDEKGKDAQRQ